MSVTLPLSTTIPAFLYIEYNDDEDCQAFVDAYNQSTQNYVSLFNILSLPVYTGPYIVSSLLDWVGNGIYGFARPVIPATSAAGVGLFNTYDLDTIVFNQAKNLSAGSFITVTDDIYKRMLTWVLYRGDGTTFSITWLKRRVLRFLGGANGTDIHIDDTSQVSVTFPSRHHVTIAIGNGSVSTAMGAVLLSAIEAGILPLPFQYTWTVTIAGPAVFDDWSTDFSTAFA